MTTKTKAKVKHSRDCLKSGDTSECMVCRTFNYGFWDAKADIENGRQRKWDNDGNLISISAQRWGCALKHYNPSYVKGYCKAYETY